MKNKNISRSAVILVGLIASFSIASSADSVIFNDFGKGYSYNSRWGLHCGSTALPFCDAHARRCSTDRMALGWFTGVNGVTVSLDINNGGAPGKALASWSFVELPQFGTTNSVVQTMTFANGIVLQPGQTYWLVTAPFAANTQAVWT